MAHSGTEHVPVPGAGCVGRDYTNPAARAYWAQSTADLFNELGAEVCQWDGAEFQPTIAGWGTNHSQQVCHHTIYLAIIQSILL